MTEKDMRFIVILIFVLSTSLFASYKDAEQSLRYFLDYFTAKRSTKIVHIEKEKGYHLFNVYYNSRLSEEVLGPASVRKRMLRTMLNEMAVKDSADFNSGIRYLIFFHEN